MIWILQKNYNKYYDQWVQELNNLNSKFVSIEIIPFAKEQPKVEVHEPAVVYGTTSLMTFAQKQWTPGAFFTPENFRASTWQEKFKEDFLNYQGYTCKLNDLLTSCPDEVFIRPNNDLKDFTGVVVQKENLMKQIENINNGGFQFDGNIEVFVAPVKPLQKEFRFFIVDGKAITGCQYKLKTMAFLNTKVEERVWAKAQELANIWTPAPVCVMDLAWDFNDDLKLLEFNCFNASGIYVCDLSKIIKSVEEYVDKNNP